MHRVHGCSRRNSHHAPCARLFSKNSVGTSSVSGMSSDPGPSSDSRLASDSMPTQHPPGFPSPPLPGLTLVDPSHLWRCSAKFRQCLKSLRKLTFERRMAQVEARTPRERSRSHLDSSPSKMRRSDDFSSQEESLADRDGRLASVVRALSPRAAQANRKIILGEDEAGGLLTISLDTDDNHSASLAVPPSHFETSGAESRTRSRKRKREKKNKRRRRGSSNEALLLSLQGRKRTGQHRLRSQCAREERARRLALPLSPWWESSAPKQVASVRAIVGNLWHGRLCLQCYHGRLCLQS